MRSKRIYDVYRAIVSDQLSTSICWIWPSLWLLVVVCGCLFFLSVVTDAEVNELVASRLLIFGHNFCFLSVLI